MTWKERIEKRFERWATFSVRYRWRLIVLMIGVTLGLGFQVPTLRFDTSTEAFLHRDDPILLEYNAFRDQFGRDEVILIAIEPPNVFDVNFFHWLKAFHEDLEQNVLKVEDVTSLVNTRSTRGEADELIVEDLLEELPETAEEMEAFRLRVLSSPLYPDLVISRDGRLATIAIKTDALSSLPLEEDVLTGFDDPTERAEEPRSFITGEENAEIVAAVRAVIDRHRGQGFKLHIAGGPVLMNDLQQMMTRDMATFLVVSLFVMGTLLALLFRRARQAGLPKSPLSEMLDEGPRCRRATANSLAESVRGARGAGFQPRRIVRKNGRNQGVRSGRLHPALAGAHSAVR